MFSRDEISQTDLLQGWHPTIVPHLNSLSSSEEQELIALVMQVFTLGCAILQILVSIRYGVNTGPVSPILIPKPIPILAFKNIHLNLTNYTLKN